MNRNRMDDELPRWIDSHSDASPELRVALARVRDDASDSTRLERLEARFAGLFGVAFDATTPPPPQPLPDTSTTASANGSASSAPITSVPLRELRGVVSKAASSGIFVKLGALLLLGAAVVTGVSLVRANRSEGRQAPTPSPLPTPKAPGRPSTTASPESRPAVSAAAAAPTPPKPLTPKASLPTPSGEHAVLATKKTLGVSSATSSSISEEARLLRSARSGTSSGEALEWLAEHERRFRHGALADERELFAIELLVRSGNVPAAVERLERFRNTSPGSPYLAAANRIVTKARSAQ